MLLQVSKSHIICCLAILFTIAQRPTLQAQVPFECTGQAYGIQQMTNEFGRLTVESGNSSVRYELIKEDLGVNLNAIGFRSNERLIYGIEEGTTNLVRVDALGNTQSIQTLDIESSFRYRAGDFSKDSRYYTVIGSSPTEDDQVVYFIDFTDAYSVQSLGLSGNTLIQDIAEDPTSDNWYGYDAKNRQVLTINPDQAVLTGLYTLSAQNELESVYFDAFGKLYGVGSTANGIAHALFSIDKTTGELDQITTGPQRFIKDLTACPYTVEVNLGTDARRVLPCTEVEYEIEVANQSGGAISGLDFELQIPDGFSYLGLELNQLNKPANFNQFSQKLTVSNFTLQTGIYKIKFAAEVGDIAAGDYEKQSELDGLPGILGSFRLSDDPKTDVFDDPVKIEVIRPVEDSLFLNQLLCDGETVLLDASPYGNDLVWNNGSEETTLLVDGTGIYTLESENSCLDIYVEFDITEALCPYTIELNYEAVPPAFFPCSEIILRYQFDNRTGFPLDNIRFEDIIPDEFSFLEIVTAPPGALLVPQSDPNHIVIEDILMNIGYDTLDIRVEVGDVPPQLIHNRASISGIPEILGPVRLSDDPFTNEFDSTTMEVLGTLSDTLEVQEVICEGEVLTLNGAPYGVNHLWEDGSQDSTFNVLGPGYYKLIVFDGCDPSVIYFEVTWAKDIEIILDEQFEIHLGDSIVFEPVIDNDGDSLSIIWKGDDLEDLSCVTCLTPQADPYWTRVYTLVANNEECFDSIEVTLNIDNTRRIYWPNAFSPNGDNNNDLFFPQSPDFGYVKSFKVFDRWGNQIYSRENFNIQDETGGWDGNRLDTPIPDGIYIWYYEIEFLDGLVERFGGEVAILR